MVHTGIDIEKLCSSYHPYHRSTGVVKNTTSMELLSLPGITEFKARTKSCMMVGIGSETCSADNSDIVRKSEGLIPCHCHMIV